MVWFEVDDSGIPNDIMGTIESKLKVRLLEAEMKINSILIRTAKNNHRYTTRTGQLRNATLGKVVKSATKDIIETYISDGISDYGKYIHKGFKTWASDEFLVSAISSNWTYIMETIRVAIQQAIRDTFK